MLRDLMGDEAELLLKALDQEPEVAVRINKRKPVVEFEETQPVVWCESGIYLKERPEFIFDPLLHAGTYYVQDPSSMIYETVVQRLLPMIKSSDKLRVLDLCAAPGGKTTAIINALPDHSHVTANEYSSKRVEALKENIQRWGYPYVTITNKDTSFFASQGEQFDIVAVDAPCSGEGMMRKEEVARSQWSPQLVEQCSSLQKTILRNAVKALKPGGFLIYSTCTFNRIENEDNAEWLSKEFDLKPINLNLPEEWKIPGGIKTDLPVYRFMPHKTKGEGLFLAVFQKPETDINLVPPEDNQGKTGREKKSKEVFTRKDRRFNGLRKSNGEKPGLGSTSLSMDPTVDVDRPTAVKYLQGEAIVLQPETPKGIVIITYKGFPLGKAKNIGTRANNLYPKNRRILKR